LLLADRVEDSFSLGHRGSPPKKRRDFGRREIITILPKGEHGGRKVTGTRVWPHAERSPLAVVWIAVRAPDPRCGY